MFYLNYILLLPYVKSNLRKGGLQAYLKINNFPTLLTNITV
jgi:hypothetical protein